MTKPVIDRLHARYGASAAPELTAPKTERAASMLDSLLAHRTVRAYLPDSLDASMLPTLMAAAQSAASSSNLQAWSVVAITDPERKSRLAVLAGNQAHIRECPLFLVWLADLSRLQRVADRRGEAADANRYLELYTLAVVDAALAAQNAVAMAEALGLGTVYIGGIRNKPEKVARELGLPPQVFAVFGMCVGRPDPARPADVKPRLPQHVVLHRERYDATDDAEAVAGYDAAMTGFQQAQGMSQVGWSATASQRVRGSQSLSGRDRLKAALTELGFALD